MDGVRYFVNIEITFPKRASPSEDSALNSYNEKYLPYV